MLSTFSVHCFLSVYFLIFVFCGFSTQSWPPLTVFHDHTSGHPTPGRTPLNERSARRRDIYQTTHNTHMRQTSMFLAEFESALPESELL